MIQSRELVHAYALNTVDFNTFNNSTVHNLTLLIILVRIHMRAEYIIRPCRSETEEEREYCMNIRSIATSPPLCFACLPLGLRQIAKRVLRTRSARDRSIPRSLQI